MSTTIDRFLAGETVDDIADTRFDVEAEDEARRDRVEAELRAVLAAADALAGAAHELARGESGECLFCSMGGVIVGPYSEDEEHAADCPIRAYRAARRTEP